MRKRGDMGIHSDHRTVIGTETGLLTHGNAENFTKILEKPVNCLTWGGEVVYDGS